MHTFKEKKLWVIVLWLYLLVIVVFNTGGHLVMVVAVCPVVAAEDTAPDLQRRPMIVLEMILFS